MKKDVIIYDDMIRSGGSLINAANAYKAAGANKVYANCQQNLDFGFTNLVSVAKLIAKGLKR